MLTLWRTLILIFAIAVAHAQVSVPAMTGRVIDLTATLTPAEAGSLTQTLLGLEAKTGSQLAVLIVPTTGPETIEQYGIRLADRWKLGRKGIDDGAILIVAKNDRTVRIEVGYGLEGALNDATTKRIVDEMIVPHFRQGDFAGGIDAGVDGMIGVIEGEPLPQPNAPRGGSESGYFVLVALFLAIFLGGRLRLFLGRLPGSLVAGSLLGFLAWLAAGAVWLVIVSFLAGFLVTLLGAGLGRVLGTAPGGWNRGSGGFRGGGGRFGGGGASGRW